MEVMNRAELTQNDILVGQKNITRSFGVSDDPMLMSMLSTGFYQNPHRTMIQEIMFNAWDAHRMGNCQDRPIDIYINETTGLIVRDYGPGIDPGVDDDNMHDIYCMYGGSTKRNQKNQTGGFGLGSKSPFAYTESFTVTSHFGGTKNMYLISRVSDANGGKPGMTSLVRVPTTETGLMVTVPLKAGHHSKTYDYVKDILFLSGIKAMIHYLDEPDEYIDSLYLPPGQYCIDEERRGSSIYAVYGGVRYKIPQMDEYDNEYRFMELLGNGYNVYVGFAPDTLSPLPNREGLNMGEKSKETVKATFELCTEKFQATFEPALKILADLIFQKTLALGLQGGFAFIYGSYFGTRDESVQNKEHFKLLLREQPAPQNIDPDVWKITSSMVISQTKTIVHHVGRHRWRTIFIKTFIKAYPECKDLAFAALKRSFSEVFPSISSMKSQEFVGDFYRYKFFRDQKLFIDKMKEAFPNDDALHPIMRINRGGLWQVPIRERTKANEHKHKYNAKAKASTRKDSFDSLYALYDKKTGEELDFLMMDKTIVIAQTAATLNVFGTSTEMDRHNGVLYHNYKHYTDIKIPAPGYIVYNRKGAYAKALEILKDLGFTILEAEEPEKKVYVPKVKEVVTYSKIMPRHDSTWMSPNPAEQYEDPTHMYYGTLSTIRSQYGSYDRPSIDMVHWFLQKHSKTVTITNVKTADALKAKGVRHMYEEIIDWYAQQSNDKDRMTNVIRATKIKSTVDWCEELITHPLVQLELGMEPVDPNDKDFWYEANGYNLITGHHNWYPLNKLQKEAKGDLETLWAKDPEKRNIQNMCAATKVFSSYVINSRWSDTKPQNRDEFIDNLVTALKRFAK